MMRFGIGLTLAATIMSSQAFGLDRAGLERCAAITSGTSRLACYDEAVGIEQPMQTDLGGWQLEVEKDPLDDSTRASAHLWADREKSNLTSNSILSLSCRSGRVSVIINWNEPSTSKTTDAQMRFGKENPIDQKWSGSNNRVGMFSREPVDFIEKISKVDSFVVRIYTEGSGYKTAVFDTRGSWNAANIIVESCGGVLPPRAQ